MFIPFKKINTLWLILFLVVPILILLNLNPHITNAGAQGSACSTDADCRPEDDPESDLGVCGTDFTCYIVCTTDDACGGGVCRTIGKYLGLCARTQTKEEKTTPTPSPKKSPEKIPETQTTKPTTTLETKASQAKQACLSKGAAAERGIFTENLSNQCVGCGDCSQCDILMVVKNVVKFILSIAGPIAILAIILGAFLYITSGGSEERAKSGKAAITAAIVGVVIVLVAWVLINFVIQMLTGGSQNIFEAAWYSPKCQNY